MCRCCVSPWAVALTAVAPRAQAIEGVDTRALTKRLRSGRVIAGQLVLRGCGAVPADRAAPAGIWRPRPQLPFVDVNSMDLVARVSTRTVRWYANAAARAALQQEPAGTEIGSPAFGVTTVVVIDCGLKLSIVRLLLRTDTPLRVKVGFQLSALSALSQRTPSACAAARRRVPHRVPHRARRAVARLHQVVPHDHDLASDTGPFHGVLISNGPGDPANAAAPLKSVRWAVRGGWKARPVAAASAHCCGCVSEGQRGT